MARQPLRLLVVDDDECDRLAVRRALSKAVPETEVEDAPDAGAGLALLRDRTFDCGFIDFRLPDADGLELLRQARQSGIQTPLVMITGFGDEQLAVDSLRSGAADYLPKAGLSGERLAACLDRVLTSDAAASGHTSSLQRVIDSAAESVMITDSAGCIRYVNPAFSKLTGFGAAEVVGQKPALLKSGRTPDLVYTDLWRTIRSGRVWRGELTNCSKDGRLFETAVTISPVFGTDREIDSFVAFHRDISAEKRTVVELQRMANTDALTGLFNRRYLMARLDEELARARRYRHRLCLMVIDLDHFKQVNDSYGHPKGDEVLTTGARLIHESVRYTDIAARFGGEEFCVVLPETSMDKARHLAERVRARLEDELYIDADGLPFRVTCSIGLATCDDGDAAALFKAADEALYAAKAAGRNRVEVAC